MATIITVPGIGEPKSVLPVGMLENVTRAMRQDRHRFQQFDWQNSYGPVPVWDAASYRRNVDNAVFELVQRIMAPINDDKKVVVIGYSGGAELASRALSKLREDYQWNVAIPAAVLVSNPLRRPTKENNRYGIAGQHGDFPAHMRLFDVYNPVDGICCCPPPAHPLRTFHDFTNGFSLADPHAWGQQMLNNVVRGRLQNAWKLSSLPAWWEAVALMRGYAYDGQHTAWYVPRLAAVGRQLDEHLAKVGA